MFQYSSHSLFGSEEVDEETMEWEQEQLRRGGHQTYDASPASKPKQIYKPAPSKLLTIHILALGSSQR